MHSEDPQVHAPEGLRSDAASRGMGGQVPARAEVLSRTRFLTAVSLSASVLLGFATAVVFATRGLGVAAVVLLIVTVLAILWFTHRVAKGVENVFARQDQLLRAAVHELYSPLGWLKISIDDGLAGAVAESEALSDARDAAADLHQLIADLVEVAQIISGTEALPDETVDLVAIANRVADRGTDTGSVIEVVADADPPAVVGSASLLRRAASNLVRNAARHGYRGGAGTITIRVHDDGITVADAGVGVNREQLERLRRDLPLGISTEPGGAGLGLAIVGWVSAIHGGSLGLEANEPQGFRATIELPDSKGGES